jgi:glyoxylase-like metal-dependent hydrolase (beta-lactamase superfamily II)
LEGLPRRIQPYDSSMTDAGNAQAVRTLDAVTVRVRAANPSPLTLTGTNTYLLGVPASGEIVVVDPGPDQPDHRTAVEGAIAAAGAHVTAVVVTHHHIDHAEATGWAADWGAPAYAFDPQRVPGTLPLTDRATVPVTGLRITALHLPGHSSDQVCLEVAETGAVLTGDHILGEGTTVIAWPDGDLGQYLASLQELRRRRPRVLYPGHGDVVADPITRIDELAAHRALRTEQIVAALRAGVETVPEIVARVYPDLDPRLWPAAGRSVQAHLADLERQGRARRSAAELGTAEALDHAGERWHGT